MVFTIFSWNIYYVGWPLQFAAFKPLKSQLSCFSSEFGHLILDACYSQVAALVPQCEIDGSIGDSKGDVQARIMTQALRKIYSSLCRSRTLIIDRKSVV